MLALHDSHADIGDAEVLRRRIADEGYLFFRGLLDPASTLEVRSDILHALARLGWTAPGTPADDAVPGTVHVEGGPGWWEGYEALQRLESFHRLAHQDTLVGTMRTLFGERVVVHPQKIARVVFPQRGEVTTPPHQDYPNIGGTPDFFTVWLPLADSPARLGGLRVLPGSHRDGIRQITLDPSGTGASSISVDAPEDAGAWATTDYRAGDVLVFHSLLVHAALPNVSDRIRVSADFRYQPVTEPLNALSRQPHFFRDGFEAIPGWDTFTAGWSSTRWCEVPPETPHAPGPLPLFAGRIGAQTGSRDGESAFVESAAFERQASTQERLVTVKKG